MGKRISTIYFHTAFFFFLGALSTSCKFNPNLQGQGTDYLQGVWNEEEAAYQDKLLQYTKHHIKFTCDSVYITFQTHSKTNIYPDSCFNNGIWNEYAKGTYIVVKDTLYITSTFTKPNFKQKLSGCYRIGQYLDKFVIKGHTQNSLLIENIQHHLPINLSLEKKIVCQPKPLN